MSSIHPQFHRLATLSGLVGVFCAAAVAFLPGSAMAAGYSCSGGVVYVNGSSTGSSSVSTSAGTISCDASGNRVVITFKPPPT